MKRKQSITVAEAKGYKAGLNHQPNNNPYSNGAMKKAYNEFYKLAKLRIAGK